MRRLLGETAMLVKAATEGQLDVRGDASAFSGAYRELVSGFNDTLDAVVTPINEASAVLAKVAERDLSVRVTGEYAGDFERIKVSINSAVATLAEALDQVRVSSDQVASAGTRSPPAVSRWRTVHRSRRPHSKKSVRVRWNSAPRPDRRPRVPVRRSR